MSQEITSLGDGRIRITLVYDDTSPTGSAQAQISVASAAVKACRGKGRAVSEGVLELNRAEPERVAKPSR
jgi:hypothetical protein